MTTSHLPLFVYGTLMSDQPAYGRLAASVVRTAPARLENATLHVVSWYPLAAPGEGAVVGEVIWLAEDGYARLLGELDDYESDEYDRVVRAVTLEQADGRTAEVDCWVYLGTAEAAARYVRVPEGDWRAFRLAEDG